MQRLIYRAWAPSNIALVKYMGKKEGSFNLPENASLSLTLDALRTYAELSPSSEMKWVMELPRDIHAPRAEIPSLSEAGIDKVLRHVIRVRDSVGGVLSRHGIGLDSEFKHKMFSIRSCNTFPSSSGIASSASSFAALTLAVAAACAQDPTELDRKLDSTTASGVDLRRSLARLSREGSGSSCRSFEGPWAFWEGEDATAIPTAAMPALAHFVILVSREEKKVSSSEAHARVKTSPLWNGRVERANARARKMAEALSCADLAAIARLSWLEAWEMHSLFHTSAEPFTYWKPESLDVLLKLAPHLKSPIVVTLDAGPNVHVLVPLEARDLWRGKLKEFFPHTEVLEDQQGRGAQVESGK